MMPNYQRLIADAQSEVLAHNTWHGERDVLLCDTLGNLIVQNPVYPREVYWHNFPGQPAEVGIAILDPDCNILYQENSAYASNPPRVTIGKPPRSVLYHVKGTAKTLEAAQVTGYLTSLEQLAQRMGSPTIASLFDLRVDPTTPNSTSVYVQPGMYDRLGEKIAFAGDYQDLSTAMAALTSGQHQLAVIILDTSDGSLSDQTTSATSAVGALPQRGELTDISSISLTTGQLAVGTYYLYYGQTVIEEADRIAALDPRLTWPPGGTLTISDGVNTVAQANKLTVTSGGTINPDGMGGAQLAITGGGTGGSGAVTVDTFANRPAEGTEGAQFYVTDGFAVDVDTGVIWQPFGPIFPLTPPPTTGWTLDDHNSTSVTADKDALLLVTTALAYTELSVYYRTAPSTPYTITVCLLSNLVLGDSSGFAAVGLCFRANGSGKLVTFELGESNAAGAVSSAKWNSSTSFSANYRTQNQNMRPTWLRIADDGTYRSFSWSADGQNFDVFYSGSDTDFLTADQVGLFLRAQTTTGTIARATLLSWEES